MATNEAGILLIPKDLKIYLENSVGNPACRGGSRSMVSGFHGSMGQTKPQCY
jgi:hypothetical protein